MFYFIKFISYCFDLFPLTRYPKVLYIIFVALLMQAALAQSVARRLGKAEAGGSSPLGSFISYLILFWGLGRMYIPVILDVFRPFLLHFIIAISLSYFCVILLHWCGSFLFILSKHIRLQKNVFGKQVHMSGNSASIIIKHSFSAIV